MPCRPSWPDRSRARPGRAMATSKRGICARGGGTRRSPWVARTGNQPAGGGAVQRALRRRSPGHFVAVRPPGQQYTRSRARRRRGPARLPAPRARMAATSAAAQQVGHGDGSTAAPAGTRRACAAPVDAPAAPPPRSTVDAVAAGAPSRALAGGRDAVDGARDGRDATVRAVRYFLRQPDGGAASAAKRPRGSVRVSRNDGLGRSARLPYEQKRDDASDAEPDGDADDGEPTSPSADDADEAADGGDPHGAVAYIHSVEYVRVCSLLPRLRGRVRTVLAALPTCHRPRWPAPPHTHSAPQAAVVAALIDACGLRRHMRCALMPATWAVRIALPPG